MTDKELRDAALQTEHGQAVADFLGEKYRRDCLTAASVLTMIASTGDAKTTDVVSPIAVALLGHAIATDVLSLTDRYSELA